MNAPDSPRLTSAGRIYSWLGGHVVSQLLLLAGIVFLFGFLGNHTVESMRRLGIAPGFSFLNRPADFEIGESLIAYSARDSYARAILVGLLNTIAVSAAGGVLATILGVAMGVARLSGNMLLAGLVRCYVEIVRNTPLLLQLFFWSATFHALPGPRQAFHPLAGLYLSNRGLFLAAPGNREALGWLVLAVAAGLAAIYFLAAGRRRRGKTMSISAILAMIVCAFLGPFVIAVLSGVQFAIEVPELKGFNFDGGMVLSPEFAALLVGLVVNAAASISEIVRGGIESVPWGSGTPVTPWG